MSSDHSTTPTPSDKSARPGKPYPDFPLFAHASGVWAKKIKGKLHYFGRWDDWQSALARYEQQREDLEAGRTPTTPVDPTPATPATPAVGSRGPSSDRPAKPYAEFPLFAHACGQWAKKIRGVMHYFGVWADPDGALQRYLDQKDALHAGRKPRPDPTAATVEDVATDFLDAKQSLVDAGELSPRTWADYRLVCRLVVSHLGKSRLAEDVGPEDFAELRDKVAKKWGPQRLGSKLIQYTRSLFKHALDAGLIDRPVRFGPGFKRPSKKVLRVHRAEQGPKLFTAGEVRRLIGAAGPSMKAMLLLGINCGFGNADCAALPMSAVDLAAGVIDYPRPKTGVARRCPLWPETVAALKEALDRRHEPRREEDADLFFITKYGQSWGKETSENPVSRETGKLLKQLGINGRKGLGFYTLRHTFRTQADETKDQPAVDFIMGHEVPHMSSVYRETISDERLRAVAEHVRDWLFPSARRLTVAG